MKLSLHNDIFSIGDDRAILNNLSLSATLSGQKIIASNWRETAPDTFEAQAGNIRFRLYQLDSPNGLCFKYECVNEGTSPLQADNITLSRKPGPDFLDVPGPQMRLYREGWSMPSPSGSARFGEKDFNFNPDYLRFAVSTPERFAPQRENFFTSEYVTVLSPEGGGALLAGFITTADRISHFEIKLDQSGTAQFDAICFGDGIRLDPGETFASEELLIMTGEDAWQLLKSYAHIWGEKMNARRWSHTPTGWCSWYYYFDKVTEADILENVNFLKNHKEKYPLEYIQIDDGYQAALGDWLATNDKFLNGLPFLASSICEAGLKPGLWLAPFLVEERSSLVLEHPEFLVHDQTGEIAWAADWRGGRAAVLDGTHPGVQEFYRQLFRKLADIGFVYVKLDFLAHACSVTGGRFYDPKATRVQALRRGLQAMREGFGQERFILGCTCLMGAAVGVVDAMRVTTDIAPYWLHEQDRGFDEALSLPNVCRNLICRRYMHKELWLNDPDVHIARLDNNKLTEDEIRLWTSALWLAGGLLLLTDRFETLDPERAKLSLLLLQRTEAFRDLRPLDFFDRTVPAIWGAHDAETGAAVYGVFNFTETEETFHIPAGSYREHWSGKHIEGKEKLPVTLPPHSCNIFFSEK